MNEKVFGVYIMGNARPTPYTGMSGNLPSRIWQHRNDLISGLTQKYHLHKLLYYESIENAQAAAVREKQIKDMNRKDKLKLIASINPEFRDLAPELFGWEEYDKMILTQHDPQGKDPGQARIAE